MNKIYKLKFDKRRNELVVVSEIAAGTGKEKNTGHIAGLCNVSTFRKRVGTLTPLAFLTGLIISLFPGMALANPDLPTGGQIVGGQGSISTSGNQMTIQQHTQNMVTNWHSFDIGKNNTVQFVQPDSSSVALNRVTGASGSQIMGTLKANGQVFILNPNGVLFGKDARVNVAGLVASTKNINTADFMKGQYTLSGEGNPGAQVINQGGLTTTKGGYIVLAADQVKNSGTITTPSGKTVLAAGKTVTLQLDNGGLTSVSVDGSVVNALVENRGLISATDGRVFLTAQGKDMLLNTVVNNSGTIEAKGLESRGGEIVLNGGDSGVVNQSGQLLADSHAGPGGKITVEGQNIHLATNSRTSATGKTGGGEVYVGGGWQGKDSHIRNASKVVMDKTATVDVSATGAGNGGTAVLWSDDYTNFRGAILAKGGALSGDGGRVETSSHKNLQAFGDVDASASAGHGGEWLLDPLDVTIVSGDVNANVTESGNSAGGATPADTDHVFSPSASGAQVSAQKISDQLNNGTSVTVDTHGDGDQAGNITFNGNATVKKTAGGDATLTLKADKDITFVDRSWSEPTDESNGAIVSTSGKLNMNLLTGNSGQNGTIAFGKYVRLYLNGGDILAGPANASAGSTGLSFSNAGAIHAGNITLNASGGVTGNYYTLDAAGDLTVKGPLSLNAGYKLTSNIKAGGHLNITASSGDIRFSAGTVNGEAAGGKILIEGKDGVNIRADNGHLVMNVVNKTINTINVSSSDGPVTLSGKVQDGSVGLTLTNVSISSKGQTTIDGTTYFGKATVLSGLNITATGDVNINGTARRLSDGLAGGSSSEGVWVGASNITSTEGNVSLSGFSGTDPKNQGHGAVGVGNSNITANAGKILLNGTTQSTTGLMVTGSNFSAASMDVKGVATIRGTGFTLTNSHLLGNLTDLTHVVFSSAGSAAGVTNLLDNSIVTTSNRDTLLKWHPENMTQINMGGDAIFDDSSNAAKGWVADFTSDSTPNGGWIFGDTKVIAGGDVSLKGVGFANSTVNISSGNLSISNSGSVFLSGSDVSASGDVVLSSVNGTVNINNINSKRTTVTSEHGSITVKANPGSAGSGYSVSLNGADLKSSTGTEITGINTGSGGAGGVYLANTNISAGEGIDINGSALSGSYSGVFLGNSVNLTAVGDINIIGHSSGPANRAYGSPDAGVYLSGRGSTLSAANINISGYNPQLKNSAGIIIGQTDVVNTPGASFTFNGNTSLYGDGGAFGIDLGVKSPNTLVFNNGNVSLTGIQRGPRDVQGTGGISAVSINAGGTLQSVNNIVTSNVSHFTINGTTGSADSRVPGIGTAGLNNQVDIINNIKINFSGQVGRLDIKGTANSGSAVNTQVFNASSLNATEGIFIQGESKSGTGVVLSQGDYSNNKVNIVGKSTSGNAVRLDNNTSLANASISGTSDTGSGVVFNGATHNLTDVTVTGQTGGATGNGILINGLTGTNVSIQGTSNGTSGIGINLAGPVQLSGNTRLDGESPTGTGLRVVQKVDVGAGSKVTLAGTSTSGTGVALRNSVNGGSVNGTSGSGAGVVLGDNAKVTSTGIFGQSTSGTGVSIEGKVSLDEASAGLLNATSDSGAGLGLRNNTVLGVVQNGGVTPVTVPVVLTGTSQTGSGVATSGNVSISGVTLKGTSTVDGSAGVTLGGKLTVADDISGVAASATGNGTALVINGAVDAKGYTEAGKDFVIGATVNGDGTAISVSGNSSLSNVALNGTATGNGSAVVVSGSLSTDKTLTATSQGQEGTGLQLSGGHLQGTTADDSPVKVVVSAAGDGTAVSVTKSDTGQSGSGLSGITLVASADRGPVLDIAGDLVTDADISVSTEHGTAISLNGGSLQGADAGHPVTVTAGATGSGTAVIVKPVAEGQPGSTLANVTLNVTSVQGDALNVEGKLNTKDVSVAAATTGTGTALNVSGGEIHSLGGTDITATSDSGHAAVVKDGKFTGDSSGGLEVTATTTTDSPALNISGTSEVSNSVLSGKNSGNGSAVTVAGTVTSSGGGEIKGQTVNGIAVETADGTSVTAAQDGGLLINATATGDKGTGVVLTNATLTGSGVHADVTQGDAVTVTGSLTGGKVSGHANGGTGLNISNAVLTNTSLSGTTQTGTGTAISGTLTGDKTSQVTGVATQDGGTGVTVSGSVTGGKVDGHATSGAGVSVAEGGSFTDTVVTGDATTGTGLNISNAVLTNTSLSGTTQTGTGTAISGTLTGDKTSQVTGVATQDGGTGVTVSGSVTGGKVDGHATSGAGVSVAEGGSFTDTVVTGDATTGTGLNISNAVLTNTSLSGTTQTGTGTAISGTLTGDKTSQVTGVATQDGGTGVTVSGSVTGGKVDGHATSGAGVHLDTGTTLNNVAVSGGTESGKGVDIAGGLVSTGTTTIAGHTTGTGTGVDVAGDITGGSLTGNADGTGTGVTVSGQNVMVSDVVVSGNTEEGTGVLVTGGLSGSGTTVNGQATGGGTGVQVNGTLATDISGSSSSGTGVLVSDGANIAPGSHADGSSVSGTGAVTQGNIANQGSITGQSGTGTGAGIGGSVTGPGHITGTTNGTGSGVNLAGSVSGGTVAGHSTGGTGVSVTDNSVLADATVSGETLNGTGVHVTGNLTSTGATTVTGTSTGSGTGTILSGNVTGGIVNGHSTDGTGVKIEQNITLDSVTVNGTSTSQNGVLVSGHVESTGTTMITGSSESDAGVRLNGTVSGGSLTGHSVSGPGVHVVGDSQLNGVEVKALSESGNTIQIDGSLSSGGSSLNGQSLSDIVTANIIRQEAYQQQGVISNTERLKHPAVASGYRGQDKPVSVEICTNGECRQIDVGTVDVPVGP